MDRYVEDLKQSLQSNMMYEKTYIHPEESGNEKINKAFNTGFEDVISIDKKIKETANKTSDLLKRTIDRLEVV